MFLTIQYWFISKIIYRAKIVGTCVLTAGLESSDRHTRTHTRSLAMPETAVAP